MKRTDYLTWDEYFIAITELSALRSKDPSTRVGACIVSNNNRILSIGYNGAPNGFDDDEFPWDRDGENLPAAVTVYRLQINTRSDLRYRVPCFRKYPIRMWLVERSWRENILQSSSIYQYL